MKLVHNTGSDRVIDLIRPHLKRGNQLGCVTPTFSLFAFAELLDSLSSLERVKLILPPEDGALEFLGGVGDRAARNRLQAPWLALCCAQWVSEKVELRRALGNVPQGAAVLRDAQANPEQVVLGSFAFSTNGLGLTPGNPLNLIQASESAAEATQLAQWFDAQWTGLQLQPDTRAMLIESLRAIGEQRDPTTIQALILHHLFRDSAAEMDEDRIVKSATGIRNTVVWNKLFKFQRDGVVGAIDKLNRFGGCIIADSVGLGKTFEALAIIKYHELRNDRVLVLAPKRLRDNWTLYKANDKRNVLAADRFNYDVLNHTDLSRDNGSSGDIDLSNVNWGNYDLVVIDESHNFRNKTAHKGKESRYDRLMRKIIKDGVKTRVLMLSATPVNNRLADLRNQIAFVTEGDDTALSGHGIASIEATTRKAQAQFNRWLQLDESDKTPAQLVEMLGFDYFALLDHLTIARSRKHVEKYYGTGETGRFPDRLPPINIKADVDLAGGFRAIREINQEIRRLNLASYAPLRYVLPHKQAAYDAKYSTQIRGGESFFRQADREESLIHLLRVNVLKRMESAVSSFTLTVQRQLKDVEATLAQIESHVEGIEEIDIADVDVDDPAFETLLVGRKVKVLLSDVDLIRWQQDLVEDRNRLATLLAAARQVNAHVDKHNMVFRLDAIDAYDRKLVKQIEVASATVEDAHNKPFVRLISVSNKRGTIAAKIELDVATASGVKRQEVTVCDGDDLEQTAKRAIYADFRVGEINAAKGEEFLELRYPGGEAYLARGQAHGDVDALAVQREMIRRTIKEHLDKEKRLRPQGIKVLSLFFIDSVERYRQYDADGRAVKGDYARIFEEEYRRAAKLPAYQSLFAEIDLTSAAEEVHDGYFSIDKKGNWSDTAENNAGNRENAERAYNLIMKEKEKLLSFDTPLKFIFSHSALKEGWDNPNVFQICALREMGTERERRQTIGRGLRLCVNQSGERLRGFEINTLTVIATEDYEQFAENLQKEIEADTGIRFGVIEHHQFAAIAVTGADGQATPLGVDQSKDLWNHLKALGHIDAKGKVQESLKRALKDGTLVLPAQFEAQRAQIAEVLRKVAGRLEIKNADDRKVVRTRQAVLQSAEFKALWDRIKHRTTYRVLFDNEKLVSDAIIALQKAPAIVKARLQWRKADIAIGKSGVEAIEKAGAATVVLDEADIELPDLLTDLQDRTHLTRRTITRILTGSGRLDDFKRNPQQFIELASESINRCKRMALVDGIKYERLGDECYYAQELFEREELTGYLKNMLMDTTKSVYEHVVYDSNTERDFATALENNEAIKVYAKLPGWFKVSTPLGSYNPDWAVLIEQDGEERLYFVVETKSSLFTDDLRDKESAKIECGKAHFRALADGDSPPQYVVARSVDDILAKAPANA